MINYKSIAVLYGTMIILLVIFSLYCGVVYWWLFSLLLGSMIFVFTWASIFVCSNFYHKVICKGDKNEKRLALTFDDGPHATHTPGVLDILKKNNIKATFFVIGEKARNHPEIIRRIYQEGHAIGNHSWRHGFWFDLKGKKAIINELKKTHDVIREIILKEMTLFRPPYGVTNPAVAGAVRELDYKAIGWSIRTFDKSAKSTAEIIKKSINKLKKDSIFLLHDDHGNIAEILEGIIDESRKMNYRIVPLDELLEIKIYRND